MPDGTISDTGMNSLNHYAYGSVMEFVYAYAAGNYDFIYQPEKDLRKPYGRHTTLAKIAKNGQVMEILGKYTPALAGIAASGDPEMGSNSLEELSHIGFLPFDPAALETAIGEISDLTVEV